MLVIRNNQNLDVQSKITPELAIEMLKDGNHRFANNERIQQDHAAQIAATARGQFPFAAVLACLDSRVPVETVFDQAIGNLFVARVAGNFVNIDILGSLEFACKVAGSKAIVIMGHSHCGAVKGACDNVKLGNLTSLLQNIQPAVDKAKSDHPSISDTSGSNTEFVQHVSDANVLLTIENLFAKSEVLKEMADAQEIAVVGAMYDVESGKVTFVD